MPAPHSVHVDRPLTNMVLGAAPTTAYVGHHALPPVQVGKQSDKIWAEGDGTNFTAAPKSGQKLYHRGPGAEFARIDYTVSATAQYFCENYGIELPLSWEELANADQPLNPRAKKGALGMNMLRNAQEQRYAALLFDTTTTFASYKSTPANLWDTASADIPGDCATIVEGFLTRGRFDPSVNKLIAIMGVQPWHDCRRNPDLLEAMKYTQDVKQVTVDSMRVFMHEEIEELHIGRATYNTAADGQTPVIAFMWGKNCGIYSVPRNPSNHAGPAVGFTPVWNTGDKGRGGPADFGIGSEWYSEKKTKSEIIQTDHYVDEYVAQASSGWILEAITS